MILCKLSKMCFESLELNDSVIKDDLLIHSFKVLSNFETNSTTFITSLQEIIMY